MSVVAVAVAVVAVTAMVTVVAAEAATAVMRACEGGDSSRPIDIAVRMVPIECHGRGVRVREW